IQRIVYRAVDDALKLERRFVSGVEVRAHPARTMTLRAVCGQVRAHSFFKCCRGISDHNNSRIVLYLRFIERRVEKSKAIPCAKLIVNVASRWVSESPVQLMRLYSQHVVGRRRVTGE